MKNGLIAGVFVLLAVSMVLLAWSREPIEAQQTSGYEYGYLLPVPRLESHEIDVNRWAAAAADKQYFARHVFVYEEGQSRFDRQLNNLRKLNELADEGWEMHDASTGLIRRRK